MNHRMLRLLVFCTISTYFLQDTIFRTLNHVTHILREERYLYQERELIQIQVLFRHGHRSPFSIYTTDPNPAELWKCGLGGPTQLGKLQHYIVGEYLRQMYAGFVTSMPKEVHCLSSAKERCTYGAYALLAGMYPPSPDRLIDGQLQWQPIPVETTGHPDVILTLPKSCPKVVQEQGAIVLREAADFLNKYKVLYEFWASKSGEKIQNFDDAGNLFKTLLVEKTYDLTIPDWATETWEELRTQADICYYYHFKTRILQGLGSGNFFRIMYEKWREKIANFEHSKKVYLYSSHGSNIASVLLSLGVFNMLSPPYSSFISFELYREPDHQYTIRVLYSNSSNPEIEVLPPRVMVLPGCTEYCPFEYLEESVRDLVERDWGKDCDLK